MLNTHVDKSSSHSSPVLVAQQLTKRYGSVLAVDQIDLELNRGSCLTLLGPNGAGKNDHCRNARRAEKT